MLENVRANVLKATIIISRLARQLPNHELQLRHVKEVSFNVIIQTES